MNIDPQPGPRPTDTYAILALVFGVLSLALWGYGGLYLAIGAVALGIVGLYRLRVDRRFSGHALAIVGLIAAMPIILTAVLMRIERAWTEMAEYNFWHSPPLPRTTPYVPQPAPPTVRLTVPDNHPVSTGHFESHPPPPVPKTPSGPVTLPCGHKYARIQYDNTHIREFCVKGDAFEVNVDGTLQAVKSKR